MAKTMLLDVAAWDLVLDVYGNIAAATGPYALAQDAASAIRLFQGELWFDTAQGVPYFADVLGKSPPLPLLKAKLVAAAMTVPGVVAARALIANVTERGVSGQVQVTDEAGRISTAGF